MIHTSTRTNTMLSRRGQTLVLALLIAPLSACFWVTTKHEGQEMRRDVNRIDALVTEQEAGFGTSMQKLKTTLEEASQLLARNSADLGAQFESLEQENTRLTGLVMEAKRYTDEVYMQVQGYEKRLLDAEERLSVIEGKAQKKAQSPEDLYEEAMTAFRANRYSDARELFRKMVIQFPGHPRADDAQYHRGETYYVQGDYKSALSEYQAVFEKFPNSTLADDAMFRAGEAAEKLKWCTDARAYFGLLRQKHPKSDLISKVRTKEASLKKNAKNRRICAS